MVHGLEAGEGSRLSAKCRPTTGRLLVLTFAFLAGCVDGKLAFPLDEGGPIAQPSRPEWCAAPRQLAEFKIGDHPHGMEGAVIFDALAEGVRDGGSGKQLVTLRVEKTLFGADLLPSNEISVVNPAVEREGVAFQAHRRYRVFAVPLRGKFYTWAATGSYDLERPADCPA